MVMKQQRFLSYVFNITKLLHVTCILSNICNSRYSQPYDQEVDATSRLQNGGFDEEYQEPQKRINYNYHPIIDFFKPEASMLQAAEPQHVTQPATIQSDNNAWKPMIT